MIVTVGKWKRISHSLIVVFYFFGYRDTAKAVQSLFILKVNYKMKENFASANKTELNFDLFFYVRIIYKLLFFIIK